MVTPYSFESITTILVIRSHSSGYLHGYYLNKIDSGGVQILELC